MRVNKYACNCGKTYKHRQSLFTHKKQCNIIECNQPEKIVVTNEMVLDLLQSNRDLQLQIIEMSKNQIIEMTKNQMMELSKNQTVINNTTNNSQFNLNFFLNEKCKDAMNITDFIKNMILSVNDLEETGRLGYVNGLSRIFINKLKELDIYTRPLHCTDYKRETVYIKDEDTWEKDDQDKPKLLKLVKQIANKNLNMLPAWQLQHPDFKKAESDACDEYCKIALCSLGPYSEEDLHKDATKIMRNVLKEVIVEKN
jgi:hypothetical protein